MKPNTKLLGLLTIFVLLPLLAFAQEAAEVVVSANAVDLVDAAVVVVPLMVLGMILKNAWESFPNRFIPLVMLAFGVPFYMVKSGSSWGDMDALVTAFLVVTSAIGVHSGLKNTFAGAAPLNKVGMFALLGAFLLAGCGTIYKPAAIVVVTAEKAMSSYGHYYDAAYANPLAFNTTTDKLKAQRKTVDGAWEAYRLAMNVVDDTRKAGGDVAAALATAQTYSDQLVNLILSFLPNAYKPAY